MDFRLTAEQEAMRDAIAAICKRFGDDYWLKRDRDGGFPDDFYAAFAENGWLGICIPEEYGGSGLGNGGAVATQAVAAHGSAQSLSLTLPPLGLLVLEHDASAAPSAPTPAGDA